MDSRFCGNDGVEFRRGDSLVGIWACFKRLFWLAYMDSRFCGNDGMEFGKEVLAILALAESGCASHAVAGGRPGTAIWDAARRAAPP